MIATNSIPDQLSSSEELIQLSGLRRLKNTIIGHTEQKDLFLTDDIINPILRLLSTGNLEVRTQASVILGSFAHGTEATVQKLLKYPVIQSILSTLTSLSSSSLSSSSPSSSSSSSSSAPSLACYSPELSASCLRILVTILETHPNISIINQYPDVVHLLDLMLSDPRTPLQVVSQCCKLIPLLTPRRSAALNRLSSLSPYLLARISILIRQHRTQGGLNSLLFFPSSASSTNTVKSSGAVALESALSALSHILSDKQAKELLSSEPRTGNTSTSSDTSTSFSSFKFAASCNDFILGLIQFTRADDIGVRLTAVELLSKLQNHASSPVQRETIARSLLPTLVPMLDLLGSDPRVSLTLSYICRDSEKHASMAVEVGVVKKIMTVLKSKNIESWRDRELIENNLYALAGIGIHRDSLRIEIVEAGALTYVVKIISLKSVPTDGTATPATTIEGRAISSPNNLSSIRKVKIAACHVLRALSRSVALIRTSLASTDIVDGIVDLYTESDEGTPQSQLQEHKQQPEDGIMETDDDYDEDDNNNMGDLSSFDLIERQQQKEDQLEVKTAVMAAICNLILEFSPVQKTIFEKGVLDLIIDGAHSEYSSLRLNSIWALKHAIFEANKDTKSMVLAKLNPSYLLQLCNDPMIEIQEQSLDFIRNFLCRNFDGVDYIFESIGRETLFELVEEKLDLYQEFPQVITPAIYILVHIAAGTDSHRDIVAQQEKVLAKLVPLMSHALPDIRTACVWLIINLTWLEEPDNDPRKEACRVRAEKLIRLGFKDKLDNQCLDPTLDVRERTKTALYQFEELVGRSSSGPSFLEQS